MSSVHEPRQSVDENEGYDIKQTASASEKLRLEVGGEQKGQARRVLTHGTFDLLHYGHVRLLRRAAQLGDYLIVELSTDEFNAGKGKRFYS